MEMRPAWLTTVFLILSWLLVAFPCRAGEQIPLSGKDTLEGRSSSEASKERAIPREWLSRVPRKRDPRLVVSAEAVLGMSSLSGELVLIDVREPGRFAELRIPGSVNLPLFAVKTKTFLKSRALVLFNEGYRYSDLEEECSRLRVAGFNASILDGGIRRWIESGGVVEGDAHYRERLLEVSPQVFFQERHFENWVVLDVSGPLGDEMASLFPEALPIDLGKGLDAVIPRIQSIGEQNRPRPFLAFLVVNRDGLGFDQLDRLFGKAGLREVYFLEGGLQSYEAFLRRQAALREPAGSGNQAGPRCPSCP